MAAEATVQVTLDIPRDLYDRAQQEAAEEQRSVEEMLAQLVGEGMASHESARQILERVSVHHRTRLAEDGKLDQTPEEILEELRRTREQVARELYP